MTKSNSHSARQHVGSANSVMIARITYLRMPLFVFCAIDIEFMFLPWAFANSNKPPSEEMSGNIYCNMDRVAANI